MEIGTVGLIGCGRMGTAIIRGALGAGLIEAQHVLVSSRTKESAEAFSNETGTRVAASNCEVITKANIVLLGCKPYQVADILDEVSPALTALGSGNSTLVSVAAGVTLATMEAKCPEGTRILRAMPSTPCMIGLGATGIAKGSSATDEDVARAKLLFEAVGIVTETDDAGLDAVTGLSGSGPAYVYQFIKSLAEQATAEGLNKQDAIELATQTVLGAAAMLKATEQSPQQLIDQVTSPGGTTLAGLAALTESGFERSVMAGVAAATARSREIAAES